MPWCFVPSILKMLYKIYFILHNKVYMKLKWISWLGLVTIPKTSYYEYMNRMQISPNPKTFEILLVFYIMSIRSVADIKFTLYLNCIWIVITAGYFFLKRPSSAYANLCSSQMSNVSQQHRRKASFKFYSKVCTLSVQLTWSNQIRTNQHAVQ